MAQHQQRPCTSASQGPTERCFFLNHVVLNISSLFLVIVHCLFGIHDWAADLDLGGAQATGAAHHMLLPYSHAMFVCARASCWSRATGAAHLMLLQFSCSVWLRALCVGLRQLGLYTSCFSNTLTLCLHVHCVGLRPLGLRTTCSSNTLTLFLFACALCVAQATEATHLVLLQYSCSVCLRAHCVELRPLGAMHLSKPSPGQDCCPFA